MARTKPTKEEVELERIKTSFKKTTMVCNTVGLCFALLAGTACVYIIAEAAVKISDKPAWLTFALAVLAVGAPPSAMGWWLRIKLKDKVALHGFSPPTAGQDEPTPLGEGEAPE